MKVQVNGAEQAAGPVIYPYPGDGAACGIQSPCFLPKNPYVSSPMVFTGIFSPAECDRIIRLNEVTTQHPGRMMYAQAQLRKATIGWLSVRRETVWLYAKLWSLFSSLNRWYDFELQGLVDEIQIATYGEGDGIDWHLDTGTGQTSTRKISLSVQLSAENDYSGGDLEFSGCANAANARRRGTIIAFPSFLAHRVTPVITGARCSLVAWCHGTPFR